MAHYNLIYKDPKADLRKKYPKWKEISLIAALLLTTLLFYAFQRFEPSLELAKTSPDDIPIDVIPPTVQRTKPPTPVRPVIPVEAEDEDIPEDLTIEEEMFNFDQQVNELPPPPLPEEEPIVPFYALSKKPVEIKRVNPVYPELAEKAGIEGMVVVKVLVNTKGEVEKVELLKSHPLLDEAAIDAAKQFKFKPGKQRDKYVKVWVSIPFIFKQK